MTTNIYNMADTWNNVATTFTAIKMNVTDTASAADSMLLDLQVSGTSKFNITKAGAAVGKDFKGFGAFPGLLRLDSSADGGSIYLGVDGVALRWQINGSTGHLIPVADNSYDIGGSSNRAKDFYLAGTAFLGSTSAALRVGTHSAIGAETVTGFITIKDSGGTDRKIAVVS